MPILVCEQCDVENKVSFAVYICGCFLFLELLTCAAHVSHGTYNRLDGYLCYENMVGSNYHF